MSMRRVPPKRTEMADQRLRELSARLSGTEVFPSEKSIEEYIQRRLRRVDDTTAIAYLRVLSTVGGPESLNLVTGICAGRVIPARYGSYDEGVKSAAGVCAQRIQYRLAEIERTGTLLRPAPEPRGHEVLVRPASSKEMEPSEQLLRAEKSE
jgi:hypothetical protein